MTDYKFDSIKRIADKKFTYNKDINQHIESCRISLDLINEKEYTIKILRNMLVVKDEEIRQLQETNLILKKDKFVAEAKREAENKELREVIAEQYKIIKDLANPKRNQK